MRLNSGSACNLWNLETLTWQESLFTHCVPELDIPKQNYLAEVDTILKRGWSEDFKMVRVEILGLRPWKWRRVEKCQNKRFIPAPERCILGGLS